MEKIQINEMDEFAFVEQANRYPVQQTRLQFLMHSIKVMDWPAQSPDLNRIENLWSSIKKNVAKRVLKNKIELAEYTVQESNKIDVNVCKTLI